MFRCYFRKLLRDLNRNNLSRGEVTSCCRQGNFDGGMRRSPAAVTSTEWVFRHRGRDNRDFLPRQSFRCYLGVTNCGHQRNIGMNIDCSLRIRNCYQTNLFLLLGHKHRD